MKKRMLFLILLLCVGLWAMQGKVSAQTEIEVTKEEAQTVNLCEGSSAAILMEESTGKVLFEKEKNRRLPPASMTKIMTLLLIYDALEANQITKETKLTITEEPTKVEGSRAFLSIGEEITVDELLKCICIASANDAAIAIAMHLSGSEEQFVQKMNEKVESLGLKNTHFSDCTGLSSKNHYTSALDLAIISRHLIKTYPDVLNYTNIQEDYIRKDSSKPFWLVNTNKMIGRVKYLDGLKTGYTSFSKYCITLHMKQNNMGLITVVFGYDKSTTRNAESLELLRWGYANYKLDKVVAKDTVVESVDHILYKNRMNIVVEDDIYYLCKRNENPNYTVEYSYELTDEACSGSAKVYCEGKEIASGNLVCKDQILKKNYFELFGSILRRILI